MAINKAMLAALKALSYPGPDVKKTYKLERWVQAAIGKLLPKPPLYKSWDYEVFCDDRLVPVRVFSPAGEGPHPILLFFHGGGWVVGNIDSYDGVCTNMAQLTDHLVISVDYRLAPEHPFPAGLEDCYAVTAEVFSHFGPQGEDPRDIILIGDSAGGNLAAAVSLLARDRGVFLPARQILLYPATYNDHSEASPFPSVEENGTDYLLTSRRVCDFMDLYQSSPGDRTSPYFAPLLAEDLSRQPRTLIITAEYCPLRDEGERYGHLLREAGCAVEIHRMPDALHGFFSLPAKFEHVRKAYEIINGFLAEVSDH